VNTAPSDLAFLDLLDPAFRPDGPEMRAARAAHWCAHTPMGLAVLRHDKLTALLSDRRLVQGTHRTLATQGITDGPLVEWMNSIILTVEGDDHTRLRRLVSRAFTPRAVTALRPAMRRAANDLVDRFIGEGNVEFMTAFADPYPARIICQLLGVPPELHDRFRGWANDLGLAFGYTAAADLTRIEAALAGLYEATDELIEARRAHPESDLLSALIAAEADGDRLSGAELRTMAATLLFAGQDTTRHQLGRTLELFLDHPAQWQLLAQRPELGERAVEEGLRLAPTTPITSRIAVVDIDIDGVQIPAGTLVSMMLLAGNTDPAVFGADADRLDIVADRPTPALTFGAGIHYCLGAALARAEMAEALPILARRLGPIHPGGTPLRRPALGITGPVTLPIKFTATAPC
jgi:cytochrome P450